MAQASQAEFARRGHEEGPLQRRSWPPDSSILTGYAQKTLAKGLRISLKLSFSQDLPLGCCNSVATKKDMRFACLSVPQALCPSTVKSASA
jgi:hypothetical protein